MVSSMCPKYVKSLYKPIIDGDEYCNDYYQSPYGTGVFKVLEDRGNYYIVESQDKKQKVWSLPKVETEPIKSCEYGDCIIGFKLPDNLIVLN